MVFRKLLHSTHATDRVVSTFDQDSSSSIPQPVKLQFSQQGFVRFLSFLLLILVVLHTIGLIDRYILGDTSWFPETLFDLDTEYNIPSYISSLLLLACSAALFLIGIVKQQQQDQFRRYWQFLSLVFFCLAADEVLSLHEKSIEPLRRFLHTDGFLYFAWVIPASILVALLFLSYLSFLKRLPSDVRAGILLAGGLYIAGGLGMELLGGWWDDVYDINNLPYALITTVEEVLELIGVSLFLVTLISYTRSNIQEVRLSFIRR
jgi:hypothetical protein